MALGATKREILACVMKDGVKLTAFGISAGLVIAYFATRILQSHLYGVETRDPATFVVVVLVLLLTAAAASFLPACRAARIHPMEALRYE